MAADGMETWSELPNFRDRNNRACDRRQCIQQHDDQLDTTQQQYPETANDVASLANMEPPHLTEDDTDDSFMKRVILHNRSMSEDFSRPQQAFSKAQVRPRNRLTLANLERLPQVQPPEPPLVTTKSDLGSIASEESDDVERASSARFKTKLEEIRQLEMDINNEYRIKSPPTPPPQEDDAKPLVQPLPTRPVENLAPPPATQISRRKAGRPGSRPESLALPEDADADNTELIRIRNMGDRLRSMYGNMQEMKSGVDNMQKLAQQAPSHHKISSGIVEAQQQDEQELVWAWMRGLKNILWISKPNPGGSWIPFTLGPGFYLLLLLVAIPLYALLECAACLVWCRPVYAHNMDGLGWSPDAPEMPFVIPTMALRPLRPLWRPVLDLLGPVASWLWGFIVYIATGAMGDDV